MQIPIQTLPLFSILDQKLIELLHSLSPEEWQAPTRAKQWTVKDIATHLLDGNLRTLSISRDRFFGDKPGGVHSYRDLVNYLNGLNADWVKATRRLSPTVLIHLLEITGKQYVDHLHALDPFGAAIFSVAWAGEETSLNWFHVAREYTEKWHHQQQIREAVNKPGIRSRELYYPVLNTFMQALPHHYRNVTAAEGTILKIEITGEAGGHWFLIRQRDHWKLSQEPESYQSKATLNDDTAWKLFTKGLDGEEAEGLVILSGNLEVAKPILWMLSVMA